MPRGRVFGDVPLRVEVYPGEETTEIFIEMVFDALSGRVPEKTGRHSRQQAHACFNAPPAHSSS
jgi:hypothetical protein